MSRHIPFLFGRILGVSLAITFLFFVTTSTLRAQDKTQEPSKLANIDDATKKAAIEQVRVFFDLCRSGKTDEMYSQFNDELKKVIDPPVFSVFCRAMGSHLGKLESINEPVFLAMDEPKAFTLLTEVLFEKGLAQPSFAFESGKITGFNINSADFDQWFSGIDDIQFYKTKTEKFIDLFLKGDADEVRKLCHPALQENIANGRLEAMIENVTEPLGDVRSVSFVRPLQEINSDYEELYLYYTIDGSLGPTNVCMTYRFVGMRGHLIGFRFE